MRISDWSSDVCSSDLFQRLDFLVATTPVERRSAQALFGRLRREVAALSTDLDHSQFGLGPPWAAQCGGLLEAPDRLVRPAFAVSDLAFDERGGGRPAGRGARKSVVEGKGVSVRVDLGGGRTM